GGRKPIEVYLRHVPGGVRLDDSDRQEERFVVILGEKVGGPAGEPPVFHLVTALGDRSPIVLADAVERNLVFGRAGVVSFAARGGRLRLIPDFLTDRRAEGSREDFAAAGRQVAALAEVAG